MEKSSSASSTKNENSSKPSEKQTFEEQSTPEEISEISAPHSSSRKDLAETQKPGAKPTKNQENLLHAKIKPSHEEVPDEDLDELAELDALDEEEEHSDEKCDEFDQQEDDEDFEEVATEEQPNPEENAKIDEEDELIQEETLIEGANENEREFELEEQTEAGDQKDGGSIAANQGLELEQEDKSSVQESESEGSEDSEEEISPFSAHTIREMSTDMPPYIFMQNKQKKRFFNRLTSEYLDAMTRVSTKKKIGKESLHVKFQMGLTQIKRFAKKQRLMH